MPEQGIFNRAPDGGVLPPVPETEQARTGRWMLSAWLLYRPDGGGARLASGGQLGASQMGARLAYDLTPSARQALAIHGRISAALQSPAQVEGAAGISWQPSRKIPAALSVERRFNISEGGRNAFAAYVAGGLNPIPLFLGLEAEGYGQAGVAGASSTDGFVDGRISVSKPMLAADSRAQITLGVAISGGAQPSLSRLDIGPQLSARVPMGGSNARLAVEWRERIAGNARPSSGPALVLAADF